ncbi:MAG: aromatic ring-hydroxylating dioxygenase subunit alpha [Pseudomonadota bacterium]
MTAAWIDEALSSEGRGLPAQAYGDEAVFALERARLFAKTWICIGLASDVAAPGDLRPLEVLGQALLLLRDRDGEVRVFHNVCRHRGHPLALEAGNAQRLLVCPYHRWSYALDGRLVATPHVERPCEAIALDAVRAAQWHGLVFVNLSGDAPPFTDFIKPLEARWAAYDLSLLAPGESLVYEVRANWKLIVENFVDYYHLPAVHQGLNSYAPMEDYQAIDDGRLLVGQAIASYDPEDEAVGRLPTFPGLSEAERRYTEALSLFPNLLVTIFADNLRIIIVEPLASGHSRERVEVFFLGAAAKDPALAPVRQAAVARFREFNAEDVEVVERLQATFVRNPFDGGHLVPDFDGNVRAFQRRVLQALA